MESRRKTEVRFNQQHGAEQVETEKGNILHVCRLAIKDLIDTACLEPIQEDQHVVQNFCVIIEHILNHRLKPQQTWYGVHEPRTFWDYIRSTCRTMHHNCLLSIHSLEYPKTSRGKGRAWIRMALMEKRLAEYLTTAVKQTRVTKSFYQENAIMLSDDIGTLCGALVGLNAIDFSFDIRGQQLDYLAIPLIDYTPYMKFQQSVESQRRDTCEEAELERMTQSLDDEVFESDENYWKVRAYKLDKNFRYLSEQKGYLEELVRLRDFQLTDLQTRHNKLLQTLRHYESETKRERRQLENVVLELQSQVMSMKEDRQLRRHMEQMQGVRYDPMREAIIMRPRVKVEDFTDVPSSAAAEVHTQGRGSTDSSLSPVPSRGHSMQADTRSIMSASSNISITREDTQSMVPMAGSFNSDTSELPPLPTSAGLQSPELLPANQDVMETSQSSTVAQEVKEGDLDNEHSIDVEMAEALGAEERTRLAGKDPADELAEKISEAADDKQDLPVNMEANQDLQVPTSELSRESPKPDLVAECEAISEARTDADETEIPTRATDATDADFANRVTDSSDEDKFEIVENNGCS